MPKPDILDPQGKTVGRALHDLGYDEVTGVRVGKYITLEIEPKPAQDIKVRVEEMCRRFLANLNVENYSIEISES